MTTLLKRVAACIAVALLLGLAVVGVKFMRAQRVVSDKLSELQAAGKPVSVQGIGQSNVPPSPAVSMVNELAETLQQMDQEVALAAKGETDAEYDQSTRDLFRKYDASNPELVKLLREAAAKRPGGSVGDFGTTATQMLEELMNEVGLYRQVSRALAHHSDVALEDGKTDEAMLDAIAILQWADHVGREPSLSMYLTHLASRGQGLDRAAQCLYRNEGPTEVRERLVKTIADYDRLKAWTWAVSSERAISLTLQDENFGPLKPLQTMSGSTAELLDLIESFERAGLQEFGGSLPDVSPTGLAPMVQPAFQAALEAMRRTQAESQAIRILAAWQDAGDDQAKDITTLKLPKHVLVDPTDGTQMKFQLTEKGPVIYSVGRDGDNGGAIESGEDQGIAPR